MQTDDARFRRATEALMNIRDRAQTLQEAIDFARDAMRELAEAAQAFDDLLDIDEPLAGGPRSEDGNL